MLLQTLISEPAIAGPSLITRTLSVEATHSGVVFTWYCNTCKPGVIVVNVTSGETPLKVGEGLGPLIYTQVPIPEVGILPVKVRVLISGQRLTSAGATDWEGAGKLTKVTSSTVAGQEPTAGKE